MVKRKSLMARTGTKGKIGCTAVMVLALISSSANADAPLVSVASIEPWHQGELSTINCKISVPFLTVLTSESDAKLMSLVPKGSEVKKGQLIAEQQNFYYQQQLSRLHQQLAINNSALHFNSNEYNRLLALTENMISAAKLEKALFNREQSQAKLKQVSSQIDELKYRIERLKFFAPKDGTVVDIFSEPGEYLNQGRKVLSFLSASDKEINCQIPVAQFDVHNPATFNLLAENKQPLKLIRTNQVVESTSQFLSVYLKSDTKPLPKLLGQRLKVEMNTTNDRLTRIPADGLNLASTGDYVWRVSDEGKVSKVLIKLRGNQSGYFLVESSLSAGEQVVTLGKSGLTENQKVEVSLEKGAS